MADLVLTHPQALLLLALLPVVIASARRRATPRGAVLLRAVVLAVLIAALAGPSVAGLGGGEHVVFAVDLSESISAPSRSLRAYISTSTSVIRPWTPDSLNATMRLQT